MITNPAIEIYNQFNNNLSSIKEEVKKPSMGLLSSKKTKSKNNSNEPAIRAMKHMEVIRNQREDIKNV